MWTDTGNRDPWDRKRTFLWFELLDCFGSVPSEKQQSHTHETLLCPSPRWLFFALNTHRPLVLLHCLAVCQVYIHNTLAAGGSLQRSRHTWTGPRSDPSCNTCRPGEEDEDEVEVIGLWLTWCSWNICTVYCLSNPASYLFRLMWNKTQTPHLPPLKIKQHKHTCVRSASDLSDQQTLSLELCALRNSWPESASLLGHCGYLQGWGKWRDASPWQQLLEEDAQNWLSFAGTFFKFRFISRVHQKKIRN